jgi:carbon-monoxide dehydrogenase iron sulfur subunit
MKRVLANLKLCLGCKTCELACAIEHSKSKELFKTIYEEKPPTKRVRVSKSELVPFPIRCQHCEDAPCVAACISGAMSKDKDGRTVHDEDKCVGCWMCIMACPFGALARDDKKKVVFKCDLCPDRETPACVEACPTRALYFGTVNSFEKKLKQESGSLEARHNRK